MVVHVCGTGGQFFVENDHKLGCAASRLNTLPALLVGPARIMHILRVVGTLSTVATSHLVVKIVMNGSRSRGVGYRVLFY